MHMNSLLFLLVSTLPVDAYLTTTARLPEAVVHMDSNIVTEGGDAAELVVGLATAATVGGSGATAH